MLVRDRLISGDQFEKLSALDGTDMEKIANVLKGSKIGQGIPFLPTVLSELPNKFGKLWEKFEKTWEQDGENKAATYPGRAPLPWWYKGCTIHRIDARTQ